MSRFALVVRELVARHATGVLAVRSASSSGEVRLRHGQIEDVVFGRAEGKRALARMTYSADVTLAFRDTTADWSRHLEGTSEELMAEAERARVAFDAAVSRFADRAEAFAVMTEMSDEKRSRLSPSSRALGTRLRVPLAFAEIIDLSPDDDADVLTALGELDAAGVIRWLWPQSERQPLAGAAWNHSRVRDRLGSEARVVFAGTPDRLAVFAHSLLYVDDVTRPATPPPAIPMPHVIATTALGPLAIEIVVCPLVPVYSPLWPLSLANAALVVRLDEAAPGLLETSAALTGVRVVSAEELVGPVDEASVGAVVAILRAALDAA